MQTAEAGSRGQVVVGVAVGGLAGVLMLNSVLLRGYTWFYDMVFVPDLPLSARTLGTDGSVPRAVPSDAVVALLEKVLHGDVVQAGLLMLVFVVVGAGAAAWCTTVWGAMAAAIAASWNPYVVERLVIGHWSFLLGYAVLPWALRSALEFTQDVRGSWFRLLGWIALASLAGSTSAVIVVMGVLVTLLLGARGNVTQTIKTLAAVLLAAAVLNAAWIVPSLTRPGGIPADVAGIDAFAARSDTPLGTWPSLLTLGGIWHEPSWPGSRSSVVVALFALAAVFAVVSLAVRLIPRREVSLLLALGGLGLLVAGASASPGGREVVEWTVIHVPGAGLIRDSQKFIALPAAAVAIMAGRVVDRLVERRPSDVSSFTLRHVLAAGLVIAPLAALPDAPTTAGQRMGSERIPAAFTDARDALDAAAAGDVAAFPWSHYRRFEWNHDKISLDPWNRLLDRRVIVNDDLPVSSITVRGEDPAARRIGREVDRGGAELVRQLRKEGVRWVVLMADQPHADQQRRMLLDGGATPSREWGEIQMLDVGPIPSSSSPDDEFPWAMALTLIAATGAIVLGWGRRAPRGRKRSSDPLEC